MRYENWDVILFPADSRTPIQEFKTQCFVGKDTASPYLKYHYQSTFTGAGLGSSSYYPLPANSGQVPVLTCFIQTLPKDTPFRVSIHSWDKPHPSRLVQGIMEVDDVLLYEARIMVDGEFKAGGLFSQRAEWPYVIDMSSRNDREGNQDVLRFPDFHPDILQQPDWKADDPYGRIQIVIAEGFSRPHRLPPFERVKNTVIFSFQHAPLDILEHSDIAWPNPNMWVRPRAQVRYGMSGYDDYREPTGHGHTPSRESRALQPTQGQAPVALPPPVYADWGPPCPYPTSFPQWTDFSMPVFPNEFPQENVQVFAAEAPATTAWRQRGARSSREDIAMLDYSSASSRAISSITGMSFEHSKQPSMATPMEDEEYTQLLENVTPTKAPSTVVKSRKKNAAEKNVIWIRPDADAIKGSAEVKKTAGKGSGVDTTTETNAEKKEKGKGKGKGKEVEGQNETEKKKEAEAEVEVEKAQELEVVEDGEEDAEGEAEEGVCQGVQIEREREADRTDQVDEDETESEV